MVHIRVGNLFASRAQTLVNTVNCVGVMGKGVALEFKKRFPDMFIDYAERCAAHRVRLGEPYLFRRELPPWILNFPTKDHWRSVSRLSDIERGLTFLEARYQDWGITSMAFPPLGCGQGGLEWRVVGPTLYRHLRRLKVDLELYAPHGTPLSQLQESFLAADVDSPDVAETESRIPASWLTLVAILERVYSEPYHWPIGRTTFQKIAYFATEAGLPTGLTFRRGSYGPFSADLKPLITKLVNNGLLRENQLGQMFEVVPGSTYNDAIEVFRSQMKQWDNIVDRISDLFLRMRTQQAEVAATVHFAAAELRRSGDTKPSERSVFDEVLRWKQRRTPPLRGEEVARAIRNLNLLKWVDLHMSPELPLPAEALESQ